MELQAQQVRKAPPAQMVQMAPQVYRARLELVLRAQPASEPPARQVSMVLQERKAQLV